jgi:ribonucleoside-diphosphate reductase alpha chain
MVNNSKDVREPVLHGKTITKKTPDGTVYVIINHDDTKEPFEVFANIGKMGSDIRTVGEAIARLTTLILRIKSPTDKITRLRWVAEELVGIGGDNSMGFGKQRVRSLPDAIGQVLEKYINGDDKGEETAS